MGVIKCPYPRPRYVLSEMNHNGESNKYNLDINIPIEQMGVQKCVPRREHHTYDNQVLNNSPVSIVITISK